MTTFRAGFALPLEELRDEMDRLALRSHLRKALL